MAAMRVVMSMHVDPAEDDQDHETKHNSHGYMTDGDHIHSRDLEDRLNGLHDYSPSLERPEPMEHMLTEDGEPMLNPGAPLQLILAFLLMIAKLSYSRVINPGKLSITQGAILILNLFIKESLASPPPS